MVLPILVLSEIRSLEFTASIRLAGNVLLSRGGQGRARDFSRSFLENDTKGIRAVGGVPCCRVQ